MQKVRLALDELAVQSFSTTSPAAQRRGTVNGRDSTDPVACPTYDNAWDTCWDSCNAATCGASCGGTCDCYSGACGGSESFLASNCQ
jgi:hypothetical protein